MRTLLNEADLFLRDYFGANYFVCIYGSFAIKPNPRASDLDLFIACDEFRADDQMRIKNLIVGLHRSYGLSIDREVPFKNKLLVTHNELGEAVTLKGFEISASSVRVPPVVKTAKFLNSKQLKYRLILNALTSRHFFAGDDISHYRMFCDAAISSTTLLGANLCGSDEFAADEIVQSLLVGPNGETKEYYLGYGVTRLDKWHLRSTVNFGLANLCRLRVLRPARAPHRFEFANKDMRAALKRIKQYPLARTT